MMKIINGLQHTLAMPSSSFEGSPELHSRRRRRRHSWRAGPVLGGCREDRISSGLRPIDPRGRTAISAGHYLDN